jgi:2-isopropylmalate synthase
MSKFRDDKYGRTLAEKKIMILKMAVEAVKLAKGYTDDVEFYIEDSGRSDPAYLFEMLEAVIDAGDTVLNVPDTTGYSVPEQYGTLIRDIRAKMRNADRVVISVHCHDDLGLAVANSLAGIQNGARQVECTINGIGEPAGNASLEEIVMAIRTRADYFHLRTDIGPREFSRTSRLVSELMGIPVPQNKAIVGANAFSHS